MLISIFYADISNTTVNWKFILLHILQVRRPSPSAVSGLKFHSLLSDWPAKFFWVGDKFRDLRLLTHISPEKFSGESGDCSGVLLSYTSG